MTGIRHPSDAKKKSTLTFLVPISQKKKVRLTLGKKYDQQFNFVMANIIKPIIYNYNSNPLNILFHDVVAYSETFQYLRRMYRFKTNFGFPQIQQRLRLLEGMTLFISDYYQRTFIMKCQYPLMVITKNQATFKRRIKRIKKKAAGEESSDYSSSASFAPCSLDSKKMLWLNSSFSSDDLSSSLVFSVGKHISFQSDIHDIYENKEDMIRSSSIRNYSSISEQDLCHLICDVQDVDEEQTILNYDLIKQKKISKKNQQKDLNKLLRKQESLEGKLTTHKVKIYRDENPSYEMEGLKQKLNSTKADKTMMSREQKKEKKQKMRDKAAALLLRVQNNKYIEYRKYLQENHDISNLQDCE